MQALHSADEAPEGADSSILPPELLNSLEGDSLPPHVLQPKIGTALILTRNVNPAAGLCNGTRLILREVLNNRVLKCTFASGEKFLGHTVLLPRILPSTAPLKTWGFVWKRPQFPVRLAFALTNAQGQTLARVAVWLERPCFSQGQFYVAASRSGHSDSLRFFINPRLKATRSAPATQSSTKFSNLETELCSASDAEPH